MKYLGPCRMRFPHFAFLLLASSALAQAPAAPDAIIARIEGEPVRMSDVLATAADVMPAEMRGVPAEALL
ncbi:MAG: hypothetical protein EBX37_09570, partial [Alphaproteobacteria bacterium]|nr:hypothetical protein [Alphaproteobacteria bacterium]